MTLRQGRSAKQTIHNKSELLRVSEENPNGLAIPLRMPQHRKNLQSSRKIKGTCILVMGLTGAGKSTFISQITQQAVPVGHSLGSCTIEAYGYPFQRSNGDIIWLIDTPGFDDTSKTNAKILRDIVSFLCAVCSPRNFCIGGLIYIHRITETRMSSSSLKSLRIFEKICGDAAFRDVTILTTMWEMLQSEEAIRAAEARESKLRDGEKHFGRLCKGGAAYERHRNNQASSVKIVEDICSRGRVVRLVVQLELEQDQRLLLADTAVGRYLEGDLSDARERYRSKMAQMEVLSKGLEAGADDVAAELAKKHILINDAQLHMGYLSVTSEDLRREWESKYTGESETAIKPAGSGTKPLPQDFTIAGRQIMPRELREYPNRTRLDRKTDASPARDRSITDRPKKTSSPSQWKDIIQAMFEGPNNILVHENRRSTSVPPEKRESRYRDDKPNRRKRAPQSRERRRASRLSHCDSLQSTDCESDTSVVQQLDALEDDDGTFYDELLPPSRRFTSPLYQRSPEILPHRVLQPNPPAWDSVAMCTPALTRTLDPSPPTYMRTPPEPVTIWHDYYDGSHVPGIGVQYPYYRHP